MTEKQYEEALYALGVKNVTTNRQKNNGTTMFELPLNDNFNTPLTVSEHKSGYIRRQMLSKTDRKYHTCYQLNPTYEVPYQVIGQDGKLYRYEGAKRRTLIYSRKSRLKALFLYTIKKVNNGKV